MPRQVFFHAKASSFYSRLAEHLESNPDHVLTETRSREFPSGTVVYGTLSRSVTRYLARRARQMRDFVIELLAG